MFIMFCANQLLSTASGIGERAETHGEKFVRLPATQIQSQNSARNHNEDHQVYKTWMESRK